ncbi:MAG: amidohydrolase family protein, partial [Acetobacteraceae bacterium]
MTAPGPIDCDLHPTVPGMEALFPYLDEVWRESAIRRGFEPLVPISYPTRNPLSVRADWRDANGHGASEPGRLGREALDPFGTRLAILNCLHGAPVLFSDDLASAFCRAVNDWLAAEWLSADPRLRASIVVPQINAESAVDEIERR